MIRKYGLFILGVLIPFFFTKLPHPYFILGIIAGPAFLTVICWKRSRPLAVGLITGVGSMAAIVLTTLLLLGSSQFVFSILHSKSKYPDQEDVIMKLEQYKVEHGDYPKNLEFVGSNVDEDVVGYYPEGSSFCLCYDYPLANIGGTCFDSRVGKAADTCFDPKRSRQGEE